MIFKQKENTTWKLGDSGIKSKNSRKCVAKSYKCRIH